MGQLNERIVAAKKAGQLSVTDMATLLYKSRGTVNAWIRGVSPLIYYSERVERDVGAIEKLIEAGKLPVPHSITQYERRAYIEAVRDGHDYSILRPRVAGGTGEMRGLHQRERNEA